MYSAHSHFSLHLTSSYVINTAAVYSTSPLAPCLVSLFNQQFAPFPLALPIANFAATTAATQLTFARPISFHWLHASTHCSSVYVVKDARSESPFAMFRLFWQLYVYRDLKPGMSVPEA
jgi:hypothetical protein